MLLKTCLTSLVISLSAISINSYATTPTPKHFSNIMVVMFENMSYAEIKNEPTFRKLVEYSGYGLDNNGHLVPLLKAGPNKDSIGNGYAFFSHYYNHHNGGMIPTRTSQPNYIAMTSGSIQGISDNEVYNLDVDNLAAEMIDAKLKWKVYADDLPDPKAPLISSSIKSTSSPMVLIKKDFVASPDKTEQENDNAERDYYSAQRTKLNRVNPLPDGYKTTSGCFIGASFVDSGRNFDDGYMRKHEPFISYTGIQNSYEHCRNIVNSSHLNEDLNQMPEVSFYIPNQINDGHNGTLLERTKNANAFLSTMLGTNPQTGEPLPTATNAPFQKFMAQGGLLVITFDEPSVTGNPDRTVYTILAGNMIKSGAYPTKPGTNAPVCYPPVKEQTKYPRDKHGPYEPTHCNHYNLLKLIEDNFGLRGLDSKHTSSGYKLALPLDNAVPFLWKK